MGERKFIKTVTARKCAIHKMILEESGRRLVEDGYFNKAAVIDHLGLGAVEQSIRWDYIVQFISEENGDYAIELVPLAQRFFSDPKRVRDATQVTSLGRYIAGGHGKKTAGYASVTFEGGRLAVIRAQRYKSLSNGTSKALNEYIGAVLKNRDKLECDNVTRLESL